MPTLPPPSAFAAHLASIAEEEFNQFHNFVETDPPLSHRIQHYYATLGFTFTSVSSVPWSAVFVSFCVKEAGATSQEFEFAMAHSVFVHKAIQNASHNTGVFRGVPLGVGAVRVGDILQNNRGGNHFDFAFAANHVNYLSHSAIVVSRDEDANGKFAMVIGGNESNSIRSVKVRLHPDGTVVQTGGVVVQPSHDPYICLIKNLK